VLGVPRRARRRTEEYLEAIYEIINRGERPGVRRLARELGVKPSSVLEYLRKLCREGFIDYRSGGEIKLTDKGLEVAREMQRRHQLIKEFLILLGVSPSIAEEDACYIEHGVHEETLKRITEFIKKIKRRSKLCL